MTKISETPAAGPLNLSDALFVGQGGDLVSHMTMTQLLALIHSAGAGLKKTAPPLAADFALHKDTTNGTAAVLQLDNTPGEMRVFVPGVSHFPTTQHLALRSSAPTVFPYTAKARLVSGLPNLPHTHFGLCVIDISTGKLMTYGFTGSVGMEFNHWTYPATAGDNPVFGGNVYSNANPSMSGLDHWAQLSVDADGHVTLSVSVDGDVWSPVYTDTAWLAGAAIANLRMGFLLNDEDSRAPGTTYTDSYGFVYYYEDSEYLPKNNLFNPASLDFTSFSDFPKNLHKPSPSDFPNLYHVRGGTIDPTIASEPAGGFRISNPGTTDARGSYYATRPIPVSQQGSFDFAAPLDQGYLQGKNNANVGICIGDDAGNFFNVGFAIISGAYSLYISAWTGGSWADIAYNVALVNVTWFRIKYDAASGNVNVYFSTDGQHWIEQDISGSIGSLTAVGLGQPTKYGFFIARYDTGAPTLVIPYFYSTEFPKPKGITNQPIATSWGILIHGSQDSNYGRVSELEFREAVGVPQTASVMGGASYADRSYFGIGDVPNAFNGNYGDSWASGQPYVGNRIWFTFNTPRRIRQLAYYLYGSERINSFDVIVSNDNMATYTVVASSGAIDTVNTYGPGTPFLLNIPPVS